MHGTHFGLEVTHLTVSSRPWKCYLTSPISLLHASGSSEEGTVDLCETYSFRGHSGLPRGPVL